MALHGLRWALVCAVTLAVCGVTVVVFGVWLLPLWINDDKVSWGVATALAVAVSAPVPLWGKGFANRDGAGGRSKAGSATASGERAVAVTGPVKGTISTGDTTTPAAAPVNVPEGAGAPAPGPAPAAPAAAQGSATASGERSVAVSGPVTGNITTGDTGTTQAAPESQP